MFALALSLSLSFCLKSGCCSGGGARGKVAGFRGYLREPNFPLLVGNARETGGQPYSFFCPGSVNCLVGRSRLTFGLLMSFSCRSALLRDPDAECPAVALFPSPLLIHRYLFEQMRLRRCCRPWRVSPRGKSLGRQQLPWWEVRSLPWPCLAKPRVWSP